jgi:proton glutamate symport protein
MEGVDAPKARPAPVGPILIALVAGAFVGWLVGPDWKLGSFDPVRFFDFLGTLFVNLLKMLIVPLISSSIITSVAALGSGRDLGRLGVKTLGFYVFTTLIAILIALAVINIVQPGISGGEPARHLLALEANAAEVTNQVKDRASASVFDTMLAIVPANILEAAANTKLLGLVFFSVLFGYFLARIELPYRQTLMNFWQGVFHVMMRMT